jgi:hypothetical protein
MLLLAALLTPLAEAGTRFTRISDVAEAGVLGGAPMSTETAVVRTWREKAVTRGALAAADAAVRWRGASVGACMANGGGAAVTADFTLRFAPTGEVKVTPDRDADAALVACFVEAFTLPVSVPLRRDLSVKYTVAWSPSAPAAPVETPPADAAAPAVAPPAGALKAPVTFAAAAPSSAPAAPAPASVAFAPAVDAERGFASLAWGDSASAHEGLQARSDAGGTVFYARYADADVKWFGAPLFGVSYAIGEDGFYAVTVGVVGTTTTWRLREALTARYGQPKWDNRSGVYFWRGQDVLIQFRPIPGAEEVAITLLDIARARASGLADALPGDPYEPGQPESDRRMPRIFSKGE